MSFEITVFCGLT